MKQFSCLIFLTLMLPTTRLFSQSVSISDDGSAALPSAMLEVKVSAPAKKGVLIPRMTNTQRMAISNPAKGLLVYDSSARAFYFHNGSQWMPISNGGFNAWVTSGTTIYNNNPGNIGIGTVYPKAKLNVVGNNTVLFGADSLKNEISSQFVFFARKGALRVRKQFTANAGEAGNLVYSEIGDNSFGLGDGKAFGVNSIALGIVSADSYGFAQGNNGIAGFYGHGSGSNFSTGSYAFVHGSYLYANGPYSQAFGSNNSTTGYYSTAFGSNLAARNYSVFVIGHNNDSVITSNPSQPIQTDPAFIIGNGNGGIRRNSFTILKNGVTAMGTSPTYGTNADAMLQIKPSSGNDHISFISSFNSNQWSMHNGGSLYFYYNGLVRASISDINGAYATASDRSLKKDVAPLQPVLKKLMQLQPYSYHYINNKPSDHLTQGFIAQDVQKLIPSMVEKNMGRDGKEYLTLNYSEFSVLAIKAIQEQQEVIEKLLKRIEALEAK